MYLLQKNVVSSPEDCLTLNTLLNSEDDAPAIEYCPYAGHVNNQWLPNDGEPIPRRQNLYFKTRSEYVLQFQNNA